MKTIRTPLTHEALLRLDFDASQTGDTIELEVSEADFTPLSKSGTIEKLNLALDKLIDEYEDEEIQGQEELTKSLEILNEALQHTQLEVIKKIIKLNETAIKCDTGMFFYF